MNSPKTFEILLVDDDEDLTNLLNRQITGAGYRCQVARSISEAQVILEKTIPHVIILDINLGADKSWPLIPWIREKSQFNLTKIFLASAEISRNTILKAKTLGIDDLLAKPLKAVSLIQKLKKTLRNSEKLSHKFEILPKVECSLYADHTKINEVSFILVSPVKFSEKTDLKVKSDFFKEIGINELKFRTVEHSKPAQNGNYVTEVTFRGMNEQLAQRIRKIKLK